MPECLYSKRLLYDWKNFDHTTAYAKEALALFSPSTMDVIYRAKIYADDLLVFAFRNGIKITEPLRPSMQIRMALTAEIHLPPEPFCVLINGCGGPLLLICATWTTALAA